MTSSDTFSTPSSTPFSAGAIRTVVVDWADARGVELRAAMDREMTERYTGRHDDDPDFAVKAAVAFAVDPADILAVVLALDDAGEAIGHAALRTLDGRFEIKRVVVAQHARGRGVGLTLMAAIEAEALRLGAETVILQTGDRQPDAVAMYGKIGYELIPTYDPYKPVTNSICFEKRLG
ncbi:GNAT family N-acetyltransferase [Marisediminicola sp. LYQ85]|uniref:GNAT family N-acetyltransferase n=1 Tax=Marisediminicola sp. LYQ85 TaxID=3391062 RepID=UPI003982DA85